MILKGSSNDYEGPFSLEEDCLTGIEIKANDDIFDDDALRAFIHSKVFWYSYTPIEEIGILVQYGFVTITGIVAWEYQKKLITSMVKNTAGVKGVINNIKVVTVWPKKLTVINKN